MEFFHKAVTATRHPTRALAYARWNICNMANRPLMVNGAFGTRLRTSSYNEFGATRYWTPRPVEAQMIRNLSSNYPLFIDVGANVGVWTVALAAAHPKAHVYCFEPTPNTFNVLLNNVALNRLQNVTAAQLALSDSAGVVPFQITKNTSTFNRLAPSKESAEDLQRGRFLGGRTINVRTVTLDDFCKDSGIERIGFLKIDAEGAEVCVLRGAENLLRRQAIDIIWIEIVPDDLREMGDSVDSLATVMARVGYTFHTLESDGSASPPINIRSRHYFNMMVKPG